MTLPDLLVELSAWFDAVRLGSHEFTPKGMEEFSRRLDEAVNAAEALYLAAMGKPAAPKVEVEPLANVIDFDSHVRKRYPRLWQENPTLLRSMSRSLVDHAKEGEIGPSDGGDAA